MKNQTSLQLILLTSLLSFSSQIWAQTSGTAAGTTTAGTTATNLLSEFSISLESSEDAISIENCVDILEEEMRLYGEYKGVALAGTTYRLKLVATTKSSLCTDSEMPDSCTKPTLNDNGDCYCFGEVQNANKLDAIFRPKDIPLIGEAICNEVGASKQIYFHVLYKADNPPVSVIGVTQSAQEKKSSSITFPVDLEPPVAPTISPVVKPGENALVIDFEEVLDSVKYEICVKASDEPKEEIEIDTEDNPLAGYTSKVMREGFSNCKTTTVIDSYRFENLENYVDYDVVYASYDEVGNRSPNSPISVGHPVEVQDFAEVYAQNAYGGGGETGGCQSHIAPYSILMLIVFFGLNRRGKRHV
jgi:hypothetical protein